MEIAKRRVKRVAIAIAGGVVVVIGVIAIPYPGPGWLIVFTGLAILATEFAWARGVLKRARGTYDSWQAWLKRQPIIIRILVLAFTALVVVATIWLLNVYGTADTILHLHKPWLHSPLGIFH